MRHIADRLRNLFQPLIADFVEHQRKNHARRKADHQPQSADYQRIAQHRHKRLLPKHAQKILEPDPLAAPDAGTRLIIFECNLYPVHRRVAENNHRRNSRNEHQI